MQRTFFVVSAAGIALLVGTSIPDLGTAGASAFLTPAADRTAVVVLAGSGNLAPVAMQSRAGFIRETNSSQANQILEKLGTSAVWTYNPLLHQFQSLATSTPKVGSAIYVRPTTSQTLKTLANPSWGAAITANSRDTAPAYKKLTKAAHKAKASKLAKAKPAVKSSKVTTKITALAHKSTAVIAKKKPAVVVTKHKSTTGVTTTTAPKATTTTTAAKATTTTTAAKAATTTTVAKATTKTPVKTTAKKAKPKPVTQTTVPATTTIPPTTVTTAPAQTSVGGPLQVPVGYLASQLEFNDTAAGSAINTSNWNTFITSNAAQGQPWNSNGAGGSTPAGSSPDYNAEYDLPGQVSESNGVIDIRATETPTNGMLDGARTVFPFASGALSSYGKFQFDGGYVQIEAKMPSGSGMWPGLWMLPGPGASSGDNYEIDMFEGGANDGGPGTNLTTMYAWHLHTPSGTVGADTNTNVNLTTSFNTYGLKWIPGQSITWYLNGNVVGSVTSAQASIPNEPMELIMNLQVANSATSAWHSVYNSTTPTTNDMLISGVQVYS